MCVDQGNKGSWMRARAWFTSWVNWALRTWSALCQKIVLAKHMDSQNVVCFGLSLEIMSFPLE